MGNWGCVEIEELKKFYKENNVPSDQLVKDKTLLNKFATSFNNMLMLENHFTPEEVADRLFKLRKSGKLLRIRD